MENNIDYHTPVLLRESVDGMRLAPGDICIDVTFGGGGHSREILNRLGSKGHLYGFDQDADAESNIHKDDKFTFVRGNFRYIHNYMRYYGVGKVDAILGDLGVSGHHFDDKERGFSFRFDSLLDMRMNKRGGETAADLLNNATQEKLETIFRIYGELNSGHKLAAAIVKKRIEKSFEKVSDLIEVSKPFCPAQREKKELAKIFQALRIEVNKEMESLKEMLISSIDLLKPGGRLVIITYHSLEDRLVKNVMKSGNIEGKVTQDFYGNFETPFITEKIITPSAEEQEKNPRSRSAKLRIATKK